MKTNVFKNHYGWTAESMTEANPNGQAWQITTSKSGKGVKCSAVQGHLSPSNMFSYEMFGAKRLELTQQDGQCTESKIKAVHEAGLKEFERITNEQSEVLKPSYVVGIGQIIFTDAMGNFDECKRVIYEIESPGNYRTVDLNGTQLRREDYIKPYTEKFGIGVYYNEGELLPLEEVEKLVLKATKWQEEQTQKEAIINEEAKVKRLKDIEEGSKIIPSIPSDVTHVIVACEHESTSDLQSDYHGHKVNKTIYLAFSKHGRDLFPELRKAAANFEETKYLSIAPEKPEGEAGQYWTPEDEHREKYSMGSGYYLGCYSDHSGWNISKTKLAIGNDYGVKLETLQIAAANDCYYIPAEEEQAETQAANFEPVKVEAGKINIIDYSEKAIAVIGDTKPVKDVLKTLGGRFNFRLTCGAGWIFPKTMQSRVIEALKEVKIKELAAL
jgi:hypothetical protein